MRIGGGLSPLGRAVPHVRDQPRVQRFPAGSYPIGPGGYSAVTHRSCPALLRLLSTAQIINPVAGRPPLSAQRPAHPEVLATQGPSAKPLSRPAEDVRSSQSQRT